MRESQLPPGRIHDIVEVELTVGQALSLARLVRAAERRKMREVDPDFDPGDNGRDSNIEAIRRYAELQRVLLDAVGLESLDEGRPGRRTDG